MSFVGGPFLHDLFITYSHGDVDNTGDSRLKQWSQAFAAELETELREYPDREGEHVAVFLDQHQRDPVHAVDPLEPLTAQLQDDIMRSAMLAVLLSPKYVASNWCTDERNWWIAKQKELKIPVEGRMAIARIWHMDKHWPQEFVEAGLSPVEGFWFYDRKQAALRPQPYDWPAPDRFTKGPFRETLLKLAGHVYDKLTKVREQVVERERREHMVQQLGAPKGQVLYLHGRVQQARDWEHAFGLLQDSGFVVLPAEPEPVVNDLERQQTIKTARIQTMSGCDAALLVARDDGRAVESDMVVVGRQDRNSARSLSNRPLPCGLLDFGGRGLAIPRRVQAARGLNIEWIDATSEPWTPAVQQWLVNAAQAERTQ